MVPSLLTVGLIGAECTGKSSLANYLKASLPEVTVADEVLREFIQVHNRLPRGAEQKSIMLEQISNWQSLAGPIKISDPHPALTSIYSELYFNDKSLRELALDTLESTDLLLWCDIDIPWIADEVSPELAFRDGYRARQLVHNLIGEYLVASKTLGHTIKVFGDEFQRATVALKSITS